MKGLLARWFGMSASTPAAASADTGAQLAALAERLTAVERTLSSMDDRMAKIARGIRHLEPATQAILRRVDDDTEALPYPYRLLAQRYRLHSQNEEDGITLALLRAAGHGGRRFVEIGSGLSGGNSAVLAHEYGWSGLMIDGDAEQMAQVGRRFQHAGVVALGAWVTRENVNGLLADRGFSGEIDLLSIDIDGNDYWIWEAMTAVSARVVVIEFNSFFGAERAVVVPYAADFDRHTNRKIYYGASLAALTVLGTRLGYRLVAVEPRGINAYFLRHDVAPAIPQCAVARAFRLLEKYDVEIRMRGEDVYAYASTHNLPLVEVAAATGMG